MTALENPQAGAKREGSRPFEHLEQDGRPFRRVAVLNEAGERFIQDWPPSLMQEPRVPPREGDQPRPKLA